MSWHKNCATYYKCNYIFEISIKAFMCSKTLITPGYRLTQRFFFLFRTTCFLNCRPTILATHIEHYCQCYINLILCSNIFSDSSTMCHQIFVDLRCNVGRCNDFLRQTLSGKAIVKNISCDFCNHVFSELKHVITSI